MAVYSGRRFNPEPDFHRMASVPKVLEQRSIGRGGHQTSILGLSTRRLAAVGQKAATRIIHEAIDHGVNVIETGHEYGDGAMERWLGLALRDGYRDRVKLMWQCCAPLRDYKTAMQQFEESLVRLRTSTVEIWSFHDVIYDNDAEWMYDHGGLDAAQEARDQRRVRWIGFGGHKAPHIHLKLLARGFPWDVVAMPLNPLDASFRSFERQVLPQAIKQGAAVFGCKPVAGGALATIRGSKPEDAFRYVWSLPVSSVLCGMDSPAVLKKNLKSAAAFQPFHAGEMDALRQKTRVAAGDGRYERYKTTQDFDGRAGQLAHGFIKK
ncbi:MAG: aldo/keto reductase [Gemmatimonadetes bacterium]|nr:aldo/keto reductase [Gemmatimonadota bacterium]